MRSLAAVLLALFGFACASADGPLPPPAGVAAAAASKEAYWKKAFPTAAKFEKRVIPAQQISEADAGNTLFYEVADANGKRLGYLRDFVGPVSTSGTCACDPINVTLAFDAGGEFFTLISPAPLTKYGHEEMTEEETVRLVGILRDPPAQLLEVRDIEDLVDATSGATKSQYAEFVVHRAALETRRLVQIVEDTEGIISGAPEADDKRELDAITSKPEGAQRLHALADFLAHATTTDMAQRAFVIMGRDYIKALQAGGSLDEAVNARILDSALVDRINPGLQADICYRLSQERAALTVAERCAVQLERFPDAAPVVSLIRGTVLYMRGETKAAAPELEKAAWRFDMRTDPRLHARLAAALIASGNVESGCAKALVLHRAAPLLGETRTVVNQCATADKQFNAKRTAQEKEDREMLMALKQTGKKVPTVDVDNAQLVPVKLDPADPKQVTVLMFFATWCPHCQAELPKVSAFADSIAANPKLRGKVRVIGVRSATERETETFDAFRARFPISFPVFTDTAMSMAFNAVVQETGIQPGFPTLLVLDTQGRIRYEMPSGEYRDTTRELDYAVSSLVDSK